MNLHAIRAAQPAGAVDDGSENEIEVRAVSDLTDSPEILGGRVKTLHPKIFAGLLARRDQPDHLAQLAEHGIEQIDVVVVNLYPFGETVMALTGRSPQRGSR